MGLHVLNKRGFPHNYSRIIALYEANVVNASINIKKTPYNSITRNNVQFGKCRTRLLCEQVHLDSLL